MSQANGPKVRCWSTDVHGDFSGQPRRLRRQPCSSGRRTRLGGFLERPIPGPGWNTVVEPLRQPPGFAHATPWWRTCQAFATGTEPEKQGQWAVKVCTTPPPTQPWPDSASLPHLRAESAVQMICFADPALCEQTSKSDVYCWCQIAVDWCGGDSCGGRLWAPACLWRRFPPLS